MTQITKPAQLITEIKSRWRNITVNQEEDRVTLSCNHGDMRTIGQFALRSFPDLVYTYHTCDVFKRGRLTIFFHKTDTPKTATPPVMWTVESATRLIQELHPEAFDAGWNLHLGGGVLTAGQSANDVDILAMPRWQVHGAEKLDAFNSYLTGTLKWRLLSDQWHPYRHIFRFRLPSERLAEIIYVRFADHDD